MRLNMADFKNITVTDDRLTMALSTICSLPKGTEPNQLKGIWVDPDADAADSVWLRFSPVLW